MHDIDGILRGKYIHIDKFHSALEGGFGFCDVVLGWDIQRPALRQRHLHRLAFSGYPDANVRILPQTCREIATEPGNLMFLCEFVDKAEEICPRAVLRRVLARAAKLGFEVKVGFEYEFFVFAETPEFDPREGLPEPEIDLARILRILGAAQFGAERLVSSDLLAMCEAMDMGIEGLHTETGAGVLEAALREGRRVALSADRQGRALQALHQGAGAEARLARHLHGQMVQGLAGLRRPHAHVAVEGRQAGFLSMRRRRIA